MALPGARRPEEDRIFVLGDEARRRQFKDEAAIHLLVEVEVEGVERPTTVPKLGVLGSSFDQTILSANQFVLHQHRDEVDRRQLVALRLKDARLERRGHAREPELPKRAVYFYEVHLFLLVDAAVVDEVAVLREFADQRIDLAQRELLRVPTLEVAPHEAVGRHADLESSRAGVVHDRRPAFLCE